MRALAIPLLLLAVPLGGCALIGGGSGEFTVEGTTYRASRVECSRHDGRITASVSDGAAALVVRLTDAPQPVVESAQTGGRGAPPFLEMREGVGRAEVTRTGDAFEVTGTLVHTQHSQNAPAGEEEAFTASFTCGRYAEGTAP